VPLIREIDLWKLSKKAVIKKLKYVLIMETDFKRLSLQKKIPERDIKIKK